LAIKREETAGGPVSDGGFAVGVLLLLVGVAGLGARYYFGGTAGMTSTDFMPLLQMSMLVIATALGLVPRVARVAGKSGDLTAALPQTTNPELPAPGFLFVQTRRASASLFDGAVTAAHAPPLGATPHAPLVSHRATRAHAARCGTGERHEAICKRMAVGGPWRPRPRRMQPGSESACRQRLWRQLLDYTIKPEEKTPLDAYVAKPDPAYKWELKATYPGDGQTTYVLEMTSQTWRSAADVDRPVWTHWMTIVKPDAVKHDKALLYIWQGDNTDPAPTKAQDRSIRIAKETGSIVAEVGMVPNQPLHFTDSKDKARFEDDIIAYTRVKHFTTKDDEWLVRLAMVKAGVKAMDATQEFMKSDAGGALAINQFVVAGASKRGWTTWLIGAVDERVIGIMPMVIDALNSEEITKHHFEVLGFFAPSLEDYVNHGLFPHKIGTPEYQAVLGIEDPYNIAIASLKIPNSSSTRRATSSSCRTPASTPTCRRKNASAMSRTLHTPAESDAVDSMLAWYTSHHRRQASGLLSGTRWMPTASP
jgi:hypothetical protein